MMHSETERFGAAAGAAGKGKSNYARLESNVVSLAMLDLIHFNISISWILKGKKSSFGDTDLLTLETLPTPTLRPRAKGPILLQAKAFGSPCPI